jgi:IS30 family transposase
MAQLTKLERQEIEYYYNKGYKTPQIGTLLRRDRSVISREIARNKISGEYVSQKAHLKSYQRRYWVLNDPQKIRLQPVLERYIETRLKKKNPWSPEQISGRWNKDFSEKHSCTISAPTIYKYLYRFRLDLCKYLCTKRRKKKRSHKKTGRVMIPDRIWIDDRPAVVDHKKRIGDWEGDTICSLKDDKTSLVVLHDRASRYICVSKSKDKTKKRMIPKIKKLLKHKPQHTLTLDNGVEFKGHKAFGVDTFFCHPYASWEKGAVEYSNRLIRRHLPKKTRLAEVSPKKLSLIVQAINNTPRKCLNYKTPHEIFFSIS